MKKELDLLLLLSSAYIAVYGYGAEQLSKINARAQVLRREMKNDQSLFSLLWVQWANVMVQANFKQATWLSQQLISLSESAENDCVMLVEAFHAKGVTSFNLGNFEESIVALEQGMSAYKEEFTEAHISQFGNDTGVLLCSWLSWALSLIHISEPTRR